MPNSSLDLSSFKKINHLKKDCWFCFPNVEAEEADRHFREYDRRR